MLLYLAANKQPQQNYSPFATTSLATIPTTEQE